MTDDHHVFDTVREAAEPRLAPGAAARIADGAWARAAASPRRGPRFLGGPRLAWAAAAAVLIAVTVLALRGTDPAFAVEGDPVMVARGDGLVSARKVYFGDLVHVPAGARVLRWAGGGVVAPRPGSEFTLARRGDSIRVEFVRGGGDVDGPIFTVAGPDVLVERDPSAASFRFTIALGVDADGARMSVGEGRALVRCRSTSERMVLAEDERAAVVPVSLGGRQAMRLARLEPWSPSAGAQFAAGSVSLLDVDFGPVDGIVLIGTTDARDLLAFDVPAAKTKEVVARVNAVATIRAALGVRICADDQVRRYTYENGSRRVGVIVGPCGAVTVDDGASARQYAGVADFRARAPELAGLFGDELDK